MNAAFLPVPVPPPKPAPHPVPASRKPCLHSLEMHALYCFGSNKSSYAYAIAQQLQCCAHCLKCEAVAPSESNQMPKANNTCSTNKSGMGIEQHCAACGWNNGHGIDQENHITYKQTGKTTSCTGWTLQPCHSETFTANAPLIMMK